MGALDIIGGIAQGANVIGGILNTANNIYATRHAVEIAQKNYELQKYLGEQNVALQKATNAQMMDMFNQDLAWQQQSQQIQNDYNAEQALKMFNLNASYNSPSAQVQRLQAAGLNPMALMGGPTVAGTSSQSAPSGGIAGSIGVPHLDAPQYPLLEHPQQKGISNMVAITDSLANVASSMKSLASAGLDTSETRFNYKSMQSRLDKIMNENDNMEADTLAKQIQNELNAYFGYTDRDLDQQIKTQSIAESLAKSKMYQNQGELFMAEKYLADARKSLTDWNIKHSSKEYEFLDEYLDLRNQSIQSDIELKGSTVNLNRANVSLMRTQEDLNRAMSGYYDTMDNLYQVEKKIKDNDFTFNDYTLLHRIDRYISECEEQGYITEFQKQQAVVAFEHAKQAAFDTDHQAFTYWSGQIRGILHSGAEVINAVKGMPFAPKTYDQAPYEIREAEQPSFDAAGNKTNNRWVRRGTKVWSK